MNLATRFLDALFRRPLAWLPLLLMLAPAGRAAPRSPAQACLPPYQPATAAELDAAIACVNAAGAGQHTISLAADITLAGPTAPLDNSSADQVTVQGNGRAIDGAGSGPIFTIAAGTTALINNVTLTGGQGDWGGGLYNQGHLTLTNSTVAGNKAEYGGGIANHGDGAVAELTISDTTVSGNTATTAGGGIASRGENGGTASLTIVNSTLSGNTAAAGGGIFSEGAGGNAGTIVVLATLAGNSATATGGGGGIHVTKSDVNALPGNASVLMNGSIISNGPGGSPDCARVNGGALISQGFNLAGDDSCNLTSGSDLPSAEAGLLPLALNPPGASATHALGYGSQAADRIPKGAVGCGTAMDADQRDQSRPQPATGMCDIGAFERGPDDPLGHYLFMPVNLVGED